MERILESTLIGDLGNREPGCREQARSTLYAQLPEITSRCHLIMLVKQADEMLRGYARQLGCFF